MRDEDEVDPGIPANDHIANLEGVGKGGRKSNASRSRDLGDATPLAPPHTSSTSGRPHQVILKHSDPIVDIGSAFPVGEPEGIV